MISNLSLSAFSAADLRPAGPPPVQGPRQRPPVEAAPPVERVRAQAETPAPALVAPPGGAAPGGRPAPRGSLLDLSV